EDDVIGRELCTIVPLHTAAQVEGYFRAVLADLVLPGQLGHDQTGVTVQSDETFEDAVGHIGTGRFCSTMRVKGLGTAGAAMDSHRTAVTAHFHTEFFSQVDNSRIKQLYSAGHSSTDDQCQEQRPDEDMSFHGLIIFPLLKIF